MTPRTSTPTVAAPRSAAIVPGAVAVCLGVFLGALDQTVVATLLPSIVLDLEVPFTRLDDAAWIVTGYLLGYTIAMPVVGRLADLRGRVRTFLFCLGLFAVASLVCGAANSLELLVAARALQAVGGGALLPVALALTPQWSGRRGLGVAVGVVGAVAEAGGVFGPLYGAAIGSWLSWRWVFYLNLPLALAIALLVWRACPNDLGVGRRLDRLGAFVLAGALTTLAIGLSEIEHGSTVSPGAVLLVVASFGLLLLFVEVERRAAEPLVPIGLFATRAFAASIALNVLVGVGLIAAMVNVPLWSATVLQRSATDGGLLLLRLTMLIPVGALVGGWAARWLGPRPIAVAGLAACAMSFVRLAGWTETPDPWRMSGDLALGGFGFGLLLPPVATTAIGWAGGGNAGMAAGQVTLARMIGMMIGLSALTSLGLGRFNALVGNLPLPLKQAGESTASLAERQAAYARAIQDATVTVFHEIFLAAAVVCLVALLPALLLRMPRGAFGAFRTIGAGGERGANGSAAGQDLLHRQRW